jgi:hypothetical protein
MHQIIKDAVAAVQPMPHWSDERKHDHAFAISRKELSNQGIEFEDPAELHKLIAEHEASLTEPGPGELLDLPFV